MEDISILSVLSQLENDLKDIKSAKEQVDAVLTSDATINKTLSTFSKQIGDIASQLENLKKVVKKELSNIAESAGSDLNAECEKISNTIYAIQNFASEIDTKQKEASNKIINDFSAKAQTATSNFSSKTNDVCKHFTNSTKQSLDALNSSAKAIVDSTKDFIPIKQEILVKLDSLQTNINDIKKNTENIEKAVKELDSDLTTVYDAITILSSEHSKTQKKTNSIESHVLQVEKECTNILNINNEQLTQIRNNQKFLVVIVILLIINIILNMIQRLL